MRLTSGARDCGGFHAFNRFSLSRVWMFPNTATDFAFSLAVGRFTSVFHKDSAAISFSISFRLLDSRLSDHARRYDSMSDFSYRKLVSRINTRFIQKDVQVSPVRCSLAAVS
jgi:hypothetical protein